MARMSKRAIYAKDKRNAACHEMGHATTACHFLMQVSVSIFENEQAKDPRWNLWGGEKTWIGQTRFTWTGKIRKCDWSVISVAGMVAECLLSDPDVSAESIIEYWQSGVISPSDTDMEDVRSGWKNRYRDVVRCLEILAQYDRSFRAGVRRLIRFHDLKII